MAIVLACAGSLPAIGCGSEAGNSENGERIETTEQALLGDALPGTTRIRPRGAAILAHDGQGAAASAAYSALSASQKGDLLAFLGVL